MQDKIFKLVEKRLFSYLPSCKRLKKMHCELEILQSSSSVHSQNLNSVASQVIGHSDPVGERVDKIDTAERKFYKFLKFLTPVTRLICDLKNAHILDTVKSVYYLTILEHYYFRKKSVQDILKITHWSRRAFYSRRYELVCQAREYMRL